jgi:hypothetical protein
MQDAQKGCKYLYSYNVKKSFSSFYRFRCGTYLTKDTFEWLQKGCKSEFTQIF